MTELELGVSLETAFRRFGYIIPFDSDAIRSSPGDAIIQGLYHLHEISAINEEERKEHTANYKMWGELSLCDVMADAGKMDQIHALRNTLDYWYKRNSERFSQETT